MALVKILMTSSLHFRPKLLLVFVNKFFTAFPCPFLTKSHPCLFILFTS